LGDTHHRSNLKEYTSGLTIAYTNASFVNATITNLALGDVNYTAGGGAAFGEIYVFDTATAISVATAGVDYKINTWRNNGASKDCTPDATNNNITITRAGVYMCNVSAVVKSVGAPTQTIGLNVKLNSGVTTASNMHAHRLLAGGGLDTGSVSLSGLLTVVVGDTVELWIANDSTTDNLIVEDANMTVHQVGG
jgi:hypothetical protein